MSNNLKDMLFEKTLSSDVKFEGRIMTVVKDTIELPDGKQSFREVVRKNGGVCIVPLTSDYEVVFVNQFRYPYGEVVKEVPAGKMEKDEELFYDTESITNKWRCEFKALNVIL